MDANETRWDHAQMLREIKEIPRTGHIEVARQEIIRLEAENARLRSKNEASKALAHHIINLPTTELGGEALELAHKILNVDDEAVNGGEGE